MKITSSQFISEAVSKNSVDRFDAELLLAHSLQKPREFLVANPNFFIPLVNSFFAKKYIKARSKGIPLAYITGHKQFFGLDFFVSKYTLIPRPDTEILVQTAVTEIDNLSSEIESDSTCIIDIGTGSGCIPISLAKTLKKNIEIFATDISRKALAIAKKNAHKHCTHITFFPGNLFEPFLTQNIFLKKKNIFLTANLPYLTQEQFDTEASIQNEPLCALVADDQGLGLYKKLLAQLKKFLHEKKIQVTCFFEIDPGQTELLSKEIKNIFPNANIQVIKDYGGSDRVVKIKIFDKETHSQVRYT